MGKAMQLSLATGPTSLMDGPSLSSAVLNPVADNFFYDTWVTFKVFGLMGLQLAFVALTVIYLAVTGALSEASLKNQNPKIREAGMTVLSVNSTK